jgi:succinate dehydrogenase flavin-adding protein (antitoxin of CptAB toxin-antitoxin module)
MTGDEFDAFNRIIRAMDNEYMSLIHKSNKPQEKGLVVAADDLEGTRAVFDVIKARAASATKRQVKRKPH